MQSVVSEGAVKRGAFCRVIVPVAFEMTPASIVQTVLFHIHCASPSTRVSVWPLRLIAFSMPKRLGTAREASPERVSDSSMTSSSPPSDVAV